MATLETMLEEPHRLLNGIINPVITPFLNIGIDEESLAKVIDYSIDEGVAALFLLGHTGEFEHLPMEMKKRIIEFGVSRRRKGCRIITGTSGDNLQETFELSKYAEEKSVDAIVLAPRFRTMLDPVDYIKLVAEQTSIPIVIYNNPGICDGNNLFIERIGELLALDKYKKMVIGVKDSSSGPRYIEDLIWIRDNLAPWMSVFQGSESALMEFPELKVDGIVAGSSNFDPKLFVRIYGALQDYWSGNAKLENVRNEFGTLKVYTENYARSKDPIAEIKKLALAKGLISSDELAPRKAA